MTKFKLYVAAIAVTAAFAMPAFAQWQAPAAFEARHPNGARDLTSPLTRDPVPSAKSPRLTVIRATKGQ